MSTEDDTAHDWLDSEAGPLVRSYALTGGRAAPGAELFELLTYVVAVSVHPAKIGVHLQPEHHAIMTRAKTPATVAEIASDLGRPLGVVRVLLNDLLDLGAISRHRPSSAANRPDDRILQAVIDGLRAAS